MRNRLRAILAADAVGYSRLMAADDTATVTALDVARGVFRSHVVAQDGRVVDTAGDSVLAVFEAAAGALTAALAIQEQLVTQSEALPEARRMYFRIGIHLGDVIEKEDGTVYGDGVNVAARLQALALAGGIDVSQAVHDSVLNRRLTSFRDLGEQSVKNIPQPVRVFRVGAVSVTSLGPPASAETAPAPSLRAPASKLALTNLGAELDGLIGRDADVATVLQLLTTYRLVTLLGTSGIGKTRMAQTVAATQVERHRHGVWWIDLEALSSGEKIEPAIAQGANLELAEGDITESLIRALSQRDMLLVLDNCEHLIADVARIVRGVLQAAPRVHFLATSQEPLKVPGEHVYRLSVLTLPLPEATLEEARSFGSVQLLEQRARAVDTRFELSAETIRDAIALCRHLDGIALAIEMAAARLPLLGVQQVLARIGERFRILRTADRSSPARHQTLHAALDWSYSLLSQIEQAVLRRLSVFVGSFRLDMAQQVASSEDIDEWAVLDALGALADKSLLQVERMDPPRYRLLETMRLYGAEHLKNHAETAATQVRHGRAMGRLAEEAVCAFWTTGDAPWWNCYAGDIDDLEEAYTRACNRQDATAASLIGEALHQRDDIRRVVAARKTRLTAARALLPFAAGRARAVIWDWLAASWPVPVAGIPRLMAAREAVAEWRRLDDTRHLYLALGPLASENASSGDFAAAQAALSEANLLEDPTWPPRVRHEHAREASRVHNHRGDASAYRDSVRHELLLAEQMGSDYAAALARFRLADAALMAGDADEAVTLGRAVVNEQRSLMRKSRLGGALHNLCGALLMQGNMEGARLTAIEAWPEMLENQGYGYLLNHLAWLAAARGGVSEAAQLLGGADSWHNKTHSPREPNEANTARLAGEKIDRELGQDMHARLRSVGAGLNTREIDALVRSVLSESLGS